MAELFQSEKPKLRETGPCRKAAAHGILTAKFAQSPSRSMQQWDRLLAKTGFRQAAANFGWLFVERAGRFLLGTIVGLVVARYLGPARLGSLSYCMALVSLFCYFPALGLDAVVKRELLLTPDRTAELLASSFGLRLGVGIVCYLAVLVFAWAGWGFTGEESRIFAILGLMLFQPALFLPDLWLQAHLRAKLAVTVQLAALALASGIRVWLIATDATITAFAWVVVLEVVLGGIGLLWSAHRAGLRFPLAAARWKMMKKLVGEAWPLIFASLAIFVYMKIDEVMLRHLAGAEAVGMYAAAVRLSEIWYFLPMAAAVSVLPALLRAREQNASAYHTRLQRYFDGSAAVAYALSVPVALLAPWIVRFVYGGEFAAAGPILAVHVWSSVFVFLGVARGQWLQTEGLQKFYLAATSAGAVANVALNFVFIPRWGGVGAAWATVVSYSLSAWIASYFHAEVRVMATMQTRALLIPFRGWSYFRR
ncbi:MAG: flippase [Opitutaceae bacterium]